MAWRLAQSIRKGELDNRQRGWVFGRLWLVGRDEPVELNLRGNCLRDLAGSRIFFKNPNPELGDDTGLGPVQEGQVGDITASRRVKVFECSLEDARQLMESGERAPAKLANCLYLEWFSDADGRVVIESTDFLIQAGTEPRWRMTEEDESEQSESNRQAIREFVEKMEGFDDSLHDDEQGGPLDEFQWELRLRESDALTERYAALLEEYRDHPDCERIVAGEMGWHWVDDAIDAEERGAFGGEAGEMSPEDIPDLEPNPETEGRDWMRTEEDRIKHPIAHRAHTISSRLWRYLRSADVLNGNEADPCQLLVSETRALSSKLSGALDGLAYSGVPDHGFVIAYLKRALKHLEAAVGVTVELQADARLESERMRRFRTELFRVREDMLTLMNNSRDQLG